MGYGSIGRLYATLLEEGVAPDFKLTAITDIRPVQGATVPVFRDVGAMLAHGVDAVIVATPPAAHYAIAMEALRAGASVAVEKPPAATAGQAEELVSFSRNPGQALYFAYHACHNASVTAARELLRNATVRSVSVDYREHVYTYHALESWVLREGVLRDSGINAISAVFAIVPGSSPFKVVSARFDIKGGVLMRASIQFSTGTVTGSMLLDWAHRGAEERKITVATESETLVVDIGIDQLTRNGTPMLADTGRNSLEREYRRMLSHMADVFHGGNCAASVEELQFVEAAERASA